MQRFCHYIHLFLKHANQRFADIAYRIKDAYELCFYFGRLQLSGGADKTLNNSFSRFSGLMYTKAVLWFNPNDKHSFINGLSEVRNIVQPWNKAA
jgi:hypothetical protein